MNAIKNSIQKRTKRWLEPELFRPFVFGVLLSLSLAEFARGAVTFSLLPTYGRTVLNFPVEWTALALSIHYLVDNLLRPVSGWLADKLGQRMLILSGFAVSTVSLFWMMHTRSISGMLGSAALYGLGMTPIWPSAFSGIGLGTPQHKRAAFMGYLYIFWLLGTGAGPVIINFVIGRTYRLAFLILIAVNILGFIMAWVLVRRPSQVAGVLSPKEHEHVREPLAVIHNKAYWLDMWRNVREMSFLFPGMFVQTFAVSSLIPILSLFAKVKLHLSGALYSSVLVSGGVFTVALLIPSGRLVDRFGPRRFLVPGFLVAGLALGLYPLRHTLVNTFLFVIVLGVSYAFILPAWNWVLDHSIDPDKKGALWGVFMTVEGAGSVVGPYVGGVMWDRVSPLAPFWLSSAVILIMGLIYLVLPIEGRKGRARVPQAQPRQDPKAHLEAQTQAQAQIQALAQTQAQMQTQAQKEAKIPAPMEAKIPIHAETGPQTKAPAEVKVKPELKSEAKSLHKLKRRGESP